MCRSPGTGGTGQTRPGESGAGAEWRGITGQRAGAVTDAHGASCAIWPRPLRRSPPEQAKATGKCRDNVLRGGSRARQSEQPETWTISPAASRHHASCPKRPSRDRGCRRPLGDGRDGCGAGNRAARNCGVPPPIPGSVLLSFTHPRTTGAIGRGTEQHSPTGSDFDYTFLENYSI